MDENYLRYYLQYAQGLATANEGGGVISMKEKYYKDFSSLYKEKIFSYIEQAGGMAGSLASLLLIKSSWKKGALLGFLSGALYLKGRLDASAVDSTLEVMKKNPVDLNVSSGSSSRQPEFIPPPSPLSYAQLQNRPPSGGGGNQSAGNHNSVSDRLDRPMSVIINNNVIRDSPEFDYPQTSSASQVYPQEIESKRGYNTSRVKGGPSDKGRVKILSNREDIKSQAGYISNSLSDEISIQ